MILGKGMIARALTPYDRAEILYCASGLSNDKGHMLEQRIREESLLRSQIELNAEKLIVYFSTYTIDDLDESKDTPYVAHKRSMENLIKTTASRFLIVRTSNVAGLSKQPGNLTNFIFQHLMNGTHFEVWTNTDRNIIDVDHLARMAAYYTSYSEIYPSNRVVYLINPESVSIEQVVKSFENKLKIKGNYSLVDKGEYYPVHRELSNELFEKLAITKWEYVERVIQKYFDTNILL